MTQESDHPDESQDEGLFKKPLSESPKRVGNKFAEDIKTKTPVESIEDDISGPATAEDEEAHLERKVQEKKEKGQ